MTAPTTNSAPANQLRQQAEARAGAQAAQAALKPEPLSPEVTQRMLHELQVHQIELELQNEALRRAQAELAAGRARYFDLYDQAPVGYVTVSDKGLILEANLTAATLLGVTRGALLQQALIRFIYSEDRTLYWNMALPAAMASRTICSCQ